MDGDEFLAQQQGKIATKMIRVASLLSKECFTAGDLNEIENTMKGIQYLTGGKSKEMSDEISLLSKAVALRAVRIASADIPIAEVMEFGNGAHIVLPKTLIGRKIRYVVLED
jgi:hypothetical protein